MIYNMIYKGTVQLAFTLGSRMSRMFEAGLETNQGANVMIFGLFVILAIGLLAVAFIALRIVAPESALAAQA